MCLVYIIESLGVVLPKPKDGQILASPSVLGAQLQQISGHPKTALSGLYQRVFGGVVFH